MWPRKHGSCYYVVGDGLSDPIWSHTGTLRTPWPGHTQQHISMGWGSLSSTALYKAPGLESRENSGDRLCLDNILQGQERV